jgi:hypothetical protein
MGGFMSFQIRKVSVLVLLALLIIPFQNCSKGFQTKLDTESSSSGGTTSTSQVFSVSQPTSQMAGLGEMVKVPVTISAIGSYSGTANVSISEPELVKVDTGGAITFTVDKP